MGGSADVGGFAGVVGRRLYGVDNNNGFSLTAEIISN